MKKFLEEFFDAVVQKNDEAAAAAFDAYAPAKVVAMIKSVKEAESPIKLKGDDVYVNGKKVGCLKHDVDKDENLEFIPDQGKKAKFAKLPDLYAHLSKEYKLTEAKEEKQLWGLYCGKRGSGKLGLEFSGTKKECEEEKHSYKEDDANKDYVYKIVRINDNSPQTIKESVKDFESEVQSLAPRLKLKKLDAFTDDEGEGLDADGDHDGPEDAKECDEIRQKPLKDLIKKVKDGGRETKVKG